MYSKSLNSNRGGKIESVPLLSAVSVPVVTKIRCNLDLAYSPTPIRVRSSRLLTIPGLWGSNAMLDFVVPTHPLTSQTERAWLGAKK